MSEPVTESVGNPGGAAAPDQGSSFLAGMAASSEPAQAPVGGDASAMQGDAGTADGAVSEVLDGPPEGIPAKFWDPETKQTKVDELAKGYTNLEKLLSREKVPVPQGDDDQEGYERWISAVKPEAPEAYVFEPPKEVQGSPAYDEEIEESYRNLAHANGLHPKQARGIYDGIIKTQIERAAQWEKAQQELKVEATRAFERKHGQATQAAYNRASAAMAKYASPDLIQTLEQAGLANDPRIADTFERIGKDMNGETRLVGRPESTIAPADLDSAIAKFEAKNTKALYDASHPDHSRVIAERKKLFEARWGDDAA